MSRFPLFGRSAQNRALVVGLFSLFIAVSVVGCRAPAPAGGPTQMKVWIDDRGAFLEDAVFTLRREFFKPTAVDRGNGVIITEPEVSRQWFEFWRKDPVDRYQTAESSLHTIRRTVRVEVEPTGPVTPRSGLALDTPKAMSFAKDQADEYRLQVTVDKTRYAAPARQVTTTSGALGIYSERLPTTEGIRQSRAESEQWVPLGRDALLEDYLIKKLIAKSNHVRRSAPWDESQPPRALPPQRVTPSPTMQSRPPQRTTPLPPPRSRPANSRMGTMQLVPG